jgi:hypothetical protein
MILKSEPQAGICSSAGPLRKAEPAESNGGIVKVSRRPAILRSNVHTCFVLNPNRCIRREVISDNGDRVPAVDTAVTLMHFTSADKPRWLSRLWHG